MLFRKVVDGVKKAVDSVSFQMMFIALGIGYVMRTTNMATVCDKRENRLID